MGCTPVPMSLQQFQGVVFVAIGVGFTGCIHPLYHAYEALQGKGVLFGFCKGWLVGAEGYSKMFQDWNVLFFFKGLGWDGVGFFSCFFFQMFFFFVDLHSVVGRNTCSYVFGRRKTRERWRRNLVSSSYDINCSRSFQTFFIFTPTWRNDPIWRAYFSNGLKPPTSY